MNHLKPYLIEETYEALDTIDRRDFVKLKEELGDVLLQVLFHSQIGTEQGTFTIDEVVQQLGDKLVRRHPHVFGDRPAEPALNSDQVVHRWEDIKRAKRTERREAGVSHSRHSPGTCRPCSAPIKLRFEPRAPDSIGPRDHRA